MCLRKGPVRGNPRLLSGVLNAMKVLAGGLALLWGQFVLVGAEPALPPGNNGALFTTAQQVLDFGLEAARRSSVPVRLQGWVTYLDPGANMLYIQDASAGIRVVYTNADYQPAPGQTVLVEGAAAGGVFAPFIDCAKVRVLGSSPSSMPEPCEAPAVRLAAGELFGQWVQVEGVIR